MFFSNLIFPVFFSKGHISCKQKQCGGGNRHKCLLTSTFPFLLFHFYYPVSVLLTCRVILYARDSNCGSYYLFILIPIQLHSLVIH